MMDMVISARQSSVVVGVDGCKAGWFAVRIAASGPGSTAAYFTAADLWHECRGAALILIDIPIGLRDRGPTERRCDLAARELLGPRASSVFPAPCREALRASDPVQASEINESLTGRRLSRQSFGILRRIREVDSLLREDPAARAAIREIHPEVLFRAFAGGEPMNNGKKSKPGLRERRALLEKMWPAAGDLIDRALAAHHRAEVGRDDILDALAAAITALGDRRDLRTLPEDPDIDGVGLPMEMVWRPLAGSIRP